MATPLHIILIFMFTYNDAYFLMARDRNVSKFPQEWEQFLSICVWSHHTICWDNIIITLRLNTLLQNLSSQVMKRLLLIATQASKFIHSEK